MNDCADCELLHSKGLEKLICRGCADKILSQAGILGKAFNGVLDKIALDAIAASQEKK